MLKITTFEFIFRGIPEVLLMMFAIFVMTNTKFKLSKYMISTVVLMLSEYLVRILPINYGVHTILNIFLIIIIMCFINKADVMLTIKAALLLTISLYVLEAIDLAIFTFILKSDLQSIMLNQKLRIICGLPSLVIFGIIITIYALKEKGGEYE